MHGDSYATRPASAHFSTLAASVHSGLKVQRQTSGRFGQASSHFSNFRPVFDFISVKAQTLLGYCLKMFGSMLMLAAQLLLNLEIQQVCVLKATSVNQR